MWMWRVCTSMETMIENINALFHFSNQQVVINIYVEDELIQREGLFFESVTIVDNNLQFVKGGNIQFKIPLHNYRKLTQRSEFKHYFSLDNEDSRVDLYFP